MIPTPLSHIADLLGGRLVVRRGDTPDTLVSGLVDTDSRLIEPGGVFVAKPGETTDGHLFVGTAVERGAALALVERELDDDVSQIVVPDVVAALGVLASDVVARVRAHGDLRIVGITDPTARRPPRTSWPVSSRPRARRWRRAPRSTTRWAPR